MPIARRFVGRSVACIALVIGLAASQTVVADDPPAPGSVAGTVLDSAGKPAKAVVVRLFEPREVERGSGGGGGGGKRGKHVGTPDLIQLAVQPAAQATTDAQGKYRIATVPAGTYTYRIGDPGTVGYVAGKVTIESGKTFTLDVKLNPPVK